MSQDAPIVIVGGGPAGSSAALALVQAGCRVLLLEAGHAKSVLPPPGNYLDLRFGDKSQWHWMIGSQGEALRESRSSSPKLRVPGLQPLFAGYAAANRIEPQADFHLVGAMAPGGLSNAWGCGVAAFDTSELGALAHDSARMQASYQRVATRMGLSGASNDRLQSILGIDAWCAPALPLDPLHALLWARTKRRAFLARENFTMGRARVAVLSTARDGRSACDLSGMCLWGCVNQATWSASQDIATLQRHPLAEVKLGVTVNSLQRSSDGSWSIQADTASGAENFKAARVLLAAGTIASTRLVLAALPNPPSRIQLLSNPMAAFLLWVPTMFGQARSPGFGLAQLSFSASIPEFGQAFGNLFSTTGLPVSGFLPFLPLSRRAGLHMMRGLLSSTIVGNVFLPGVFSHHHVSLSAGGVLRIGTSEHEGQAGAWSEVRRELAASLGKLGAHMLPGSFVPGAPGADLHYASTLPISLEPSPHQCNMLGEVAALPGLHVVDGASLPGLPAKAHTLTIMANADRIGRILAAA